LVQDSLLLIAIKEYIPTTAIREGAVHFNRLYDEEGEDPDLRKDVWAVLYKIKSETGNGNDKHYYPSLAQQINGPTSQELYHDDEEAWFDTTCRSGDGKVFCAVTFLPNEQTEEIAKASVFEIRRTEQSGTEEIILRQEIAVDTFGGDAEYSRLGIRMSTDGGILSILNQ
jgi:hypothetical protein